HALPSATPVIELNDADFMTLRNVTLVGGSGVWVHHGSTDLTLDHLTVRQSATDGLRIEDGSAALSLDHITATDNRRYGIYVDGPLGSLRHSVAAHNIDTGIRLINVGATPVEDNDVYNNSGYGVDVLNTGPGTTIIGNSDLSLGLGNKVHDNTRGGITVSGAARVAGNAVFGHAGGGAVGIQAGGTVQTLRN